MRAIIILDSLDKPPPTQRDLLLTIGVLLGILAVGGLALYALVK
jgi:hypothetical protein